MIRNIQNKASIKKLDEGSPFTTDHNGGYNREMRAGQADLQAFTGAILYRAAHKTHRQGHEIIKSHLSLFECPSEPVMKPHVVYGRKAIGQKF